MMNRIDNPDNLLNHWLLILVGPKRQVSKVERPSARLLIRINYVSKERGVSETQLSNVGNGWSHAVMDDHGSLDLFKAVDRDRLENLRIDLDRPLKIEDVVLIQYWKFRPLIWAFRDPCMRRSRSIPQNF